MNYETCGSNIMVIALLYASLSYGKSHTSPAKRIGSTAAQNKARAVRMKPHAQAPVIKQQPKKQKASEKDVDLFLQGKKDCLSGYDMSRLSISHFARNECPSSNRFGVRY